MHTTVVRIAAAALLGGAAVASALAADPPRTAPNNAAPKTTTPNDTAQAAVQHFRVSTLEGMPVRNAAGEDLGKIKDMVIDIRTGKVAYVALDFGGFLGIGDKLFAIPWTALKYQPKPDDDHLVLNVSKERLKQAPGFDKSHWPNMADPRWIHDVDTYYQSTSTR